MKRVRNLFFIIILGMVLYLSSCSSTENEKPVKPVNSEAVSSVDINDVPVEEDRGVYVNDVDDSVKVLYVTVLKADPRQDVKLSTFNEINHPKQLNDPLKAEVVFQEGDERGPQVGYFGYDKTVSNGIIELRGRSNRESESKSYKITLSKNSGKWNSQKIINLNKHTYDWSKVRNKLSFDYFKIIPDFTSLRTQFVHLYVKDLSAGNSKSSFEDYGLFTQIEQPNKSFLKSHGLDPEGELYKAEEFEFYRYETEIKLRTDPTYKLIDFQSRLSIKGNEDHSKLISMLEDINNYNITINDVIKKHFNRDNLLNWMAINIIMGNADVMTQNYFLYSPLNSNIWYFMPWDYDGAWGYKNQRDSNKDPKWTNTIAVYWGNQLCKRFLKDKSNYEALIKKVDDLHNVINKTNTEKMLNKYYKITSSFELRMPDFMHLKASKEEFTNEYKKIALIPEVNVKNFKATLELPMPVFLGNIKIKNNSMNFIWDNSYDFQSDSIKYDFEISTKPDFSTIIFRQHNYSDNNINVKLLANGVYYWRVSIKDSKGNKQIPYDRFTDLEGKIYFGLRQFIIRNNGVVK